MTISPLRQFILSAVLWLPLSFALWAWFASPVVWPAARISDVVLRAQLPDTVEGVTQDVARLEINTRILTEPDARGRVGLLVLEASPMVYAWCLPLFAGLVMATPLSGRRRLLQFAIGFPVLWLVVSWGAVFDALYLLQFRAGPLGQAALARHGWSADAIGLGYQFGYLILPTVTPVSLWILLNRRFLESLVGWSGEPTEPDAGQTPANRGEDSA